mmetsp:Transcript_28722/g.80865  ORF Transcript_28722/g.80865 Transcript_28722/m.80865 type:complete len:168 (+) Transcript_28722:111-614(+)|eukprot:CAMPEP_0117668934 /NCGR_PEP_ID=MMETSP0804-20121206/11838_1 /TAXON_ID=1074897 /ORGANISM="Tetraselmis astigmatica, Strain CCMP880" /LENGTH=167 /DNA_ID=CAMNT_0005476907 /DNA_START=97 /DNA_END=600 /DNA_ORIENTATION=+
MSASAVTTASAAARSHPTARPGNGRALRSPKAFLAGRCLRTTVSNTTEKKVAAFFNFGKDKNIYNAGGSERSEYEDEDVEFYFNYMGMLATEGTYDRMYELMKDREPVDVILLMAATEGDIPKLNELIASGADPTITDPDGKTPLDLATKPEARAILEEALAARAWE